MQTVTSQEGPHYYGGREVQSFTRGPGLLLILLAVFLGVSKWSWAAKPETRPYSWMPGVPLDDSPNKKNDTLTYRLQFVDPNNANGVTTSDVTVNVAAWDPKTETALQAQARKTKAIADAINAAKLNGVTAAVMPKQTGIVWDPIRRQFVPVIQQELTLNGLAIDPQRVRDPQIAVVKDPTKQPQGGRANLPQKSGGGGGSMYNGSMNGTKSGMSTGVDPFGSQSMIAFGFYSNSGSTIDVATLLPSAGETDNQILGGLASAFDTDFGQSGFTADFNAAQDTLTFDQPLNDNFFFFTDDTDTGINFNMQIAALPSVPEPSSMLLMGSGLLGIGTILRRRLRRGKTRAQSAGRVG